MNSKRLRIYKKHLRKNPHLCKVLEQIELHKDTHKDAMQKHQTKNMLEWQTQDVLEGIAWHVLAPTKHMFMVWTLQQALEKKVERLYFLARDAYLMFKVADKICREFDLPIECRYFYCSRFSLRTPLYHLNIEQALDHICAYGLEMNLGVVLERTGLSREQQEEVIQHLKTDFKREEEIPFSRIKEVRQSLRECELFIQYFTEYSKGLTPYLLGYLEQEGLFEDVNYAVVDSGWVGSTQKTFNQALGQCGLEKRVIGFYWGLYDLPSKNKQEDYHTYYFGPGKNIKEKVNFSNSLFEAIFSAPHGTTTGYKEIGGKYEPIYLEAHKEKIDFIQSIEEILLQYTELFIKDVSDIEKIDVLKARKTIYQMLRLFMGKPSEEEARYFGGLIFSYDFKEDGTQYIAAKFTRRDLKNYQLIPRVMAMLGLRNEKIKESGWPEGSIVLYGERVNYHLLQSALYKRLSYMRLKMLWRLKK